MQREVSSAEQPFFLFPRFALRSKEEALQEIERPCGRFRSPLSRDERMRLFVTRGLAGLDPLSNITNVLAPGTPLNWQALLHYLHREDIIETPQFLMSLRRNDLPKIFGVGLKTVWDDSLTLGRRVSGNGYASAASTELALSKAVGETLERNFLLHYTDDELVRASYDQLRARGQRALDIRELNAFLPWQQEHNRRFGHRDRPLSWVLGKTISGKPAYLPAQLVFWNYDFERYPDEPTLGQPTTNGAGGHFTENEAILSGLLENIQRDGFLMYWLNGLSPRAIDPATMDDPDTRAFLGSLDRYGLDAYLLDTTSDIGVPSATCVIVDRRAQVPMLAMGAGTGFTARDTLLHAMHEALSVLHASAQSPSYELMESYQAFRDFGIGRTERLALWRGERMLEHIGFFLKGEPKSVEEFMRGAERISEMERLPHVLHLLAQKGRGYEVYVYSVRHRVLEALGYHVVQTIVPRLMPLYLNENMATLDAPRLHEVPPLLGYSASETLNPWPHPFP